MTPLHSGDLLLEFLKSPKQTFGNSMKTLSVTRNERGFPRTARSER